MQNMLPHAIALSGIAQLLVLIASAQVPARLKWKQEFKVLSPLHRQMYWVYGGYVVMAIVAFGMLSLCNAQELAGGSRLARGVCGYMAVFWGVRLVLQAFLAVSEHLRSFWLKLGYHTLTVLFAWFTVVYGYAALRW